MSDADPRDPEGEFRGPWFTSRQAQQYVCCTTLKGWYVWRRRHGILPRSNGSVAKADLDRVLRRRTPQGHAPGSDHGSPVAVAAADPFRGPWFASRTAQQYVCCKTLKAYYEWRRRHGIIPRSYGRVAKADLDRILRRRPPRREMHPASLANLAKRAAVA